MTAVDFACEPFLPAPAGRAAALDRLRRCLDGTPPATADAVLRAFLGFAVPAAAFHLRGVHHVGLYAGDYRREEEVEAWHAWLADAPGVEEVRTGPSYVLPRHYGVAGHWASLRLDGRAVELFTARHAPPWDGMDPRRKALRMSHVALEVRGGRHLRPALDYLAHYPGIELLSFSPRDELGHGYGHLLNRATDRVVELVSDAGAHRRGAQAAPRAKRTPGRRPWPRG